MRGKGYVMLIEDWLRGCVHHDGKNGYVTLPCDEVRKIADYIESTRSKVEVVRCRDCKYQDKGENESDSWNLCGFRPWLYIPTSDDHFCGYGERGEENGN